MNTNLFKTSIFAVLLFFLLCFNAFRLASVCAALSTTGHFSSFGIYGSKVWLLSPLSRSRSRG